MPSYLADRNPAIFSSSTPVLDLDLPDNQFGIGFTAAKIKPNEASINHTRSSPGNESFDGSSTVSTHDSDISDVNHLPLNGHQHDHEHWHDHANGNGTRPTSMSSFANANSLPGAMDPRETIERNMAMNGTTATALSDRTVRHFPNDTTNGSNNAHINSLDFSDGATDTSTIPFPSEQSHQQPSDYHQRFSLRSNEDQSTQSMSASPTDATPHSPTKPRTPSFTPASYTTSELVVPRASPHRFSSPPAYQPGGSSPGLLQSTAAGAALKQRHTHNLEVPKLAPGRGSKDGLDLAQASGRFSPTITTAGGRRASLNLARRTTRSMQSDHPRDEIVPDEDAIRWAEAYRQKRASKRRRKEEEDDDRVLVGTKVDESHANWVTAYNMLTGIRVSVSRTNAKLDRELTNADFDVKQKSTFDITGNELVPSAKYDFKFKDYAPWVFRRLRSSFRLDPADYLMSLTGKYILSELGSPGKSGSFFYFSRDYKYIIKTIHHAEHKFLRKILREYYDHVQQNPNTLLSQFYGLHRVKMPYGKKIHFVVMNNLFPPHRDIHTTFDLKGSTIGRDYREDDLEKNPRATLKDLNWLRRQRNLELGIQKKKLFLEQLEKDVVLLKRLQIMDYSLLVGIHDLSRGNDENLRDKTLQVFNPGGEKPMEEDLQATLLRTPSKLETYRKAKELRQMVRLERPVPMGQATDKMPDELGEDHSRRGFVFNQDDGGFRATHENNEPAEEIYYLGVIDCLTHYGIIKKIEHFWKGLSSDRTKISALPPDQYGNRFYNFVEGVTMSPEEARREAQRRDEAMQAQAQQESEREMNRSNTTPGHSIPPMPCHQPPAPPVGPRSPEARQVVEMAEEEARRTERNGASESTVPERTLKTNVLPSDTWESQHEPILLPVVKEVGEGSRDEVNHWSSSESPATFSGYAPAPSRAPPPTPPHSQPWLKPDSSDSGYGDNSNGTLSRDNSLKVVRPKVSRESLNKNLPPLPKGEETNDSGIRMVF